MISSSRIFNIELDGEENSGETSGASLDSTSVFIGTGLDRYVRTCILLFSERSPDSCVNVVQLSTSYVAQLKDITQKLVSSVRTVSGHATDGRRVIGQLCIKSSSVPDSTQHVLKKFDSMLLQAQDQLQLLEQLVSKGEFFCRELHSGKRSTPPADVDSNNEDNAAETPRCKKMRLQGYSCL